MAFDEGWYKTSDSRTIHIFPLKNAKGRYMVSHFLPSQNRTDRDPYDEIKLGQYNPKPIEDIEKHMDGLLRTIQGVTSELLFIRETKRYCESVRGTQSEQPIQPLPSGPAG